MSTVQCRIDPEQKRAALEQALDSTTFARADQLRRFLRYICEAEMAGRSQEISDYSIATEALGRAPGYTPGDDSSVRSRAHALRQKLHEFYETEQPDAPVRIELRKGSYIPTFTERPHPLPAADAPVTRPQPSSWRAPKPFALGAVTAAIGMAAMYLALSRSPVAIEPILREAWGTMLQPGADVVVCVGSPPALLLKSFRTNTIPSVPRLLPVPKEVSEWYAGLKEADGGGDLYMQTTMNTVLSGDALAAIRATRLLSTAGASIQVLPEWGLRPLALRGRNVVLIGSPNYSPYASRILGNVPFSVRYDTLQKEEVISDGPPESPNSQVFRPKRNQFGDLTQVFGLLTVLPSHSGGEGQERTFIFSGITSAGPQAAMELFTSARGLESLKSSLAREGHTRLPAAYQVVVRSGVDRTLALTWAYETHRVLKNPPSLE